jgi:hypothetical protein
MTERQLETEYNCKLKFICILFNVDSSFSSLNYSRAGLGGQEHIANHLLAQVRLPARLTVRNIRNITTFLVIA